MVKMTEPKVEKRKEQPYIGIRSQVPMREMPDFIRQSVDEAFAWINRKGIKPAGPPFLRFHVINMESKMDIEIGIPVAKPVPADGRVIPGTLPAGRYATLIYTGVKNGIEANAALLDWGAKNGLKFDRWDDANGDAFAGRYETFLSGPEDDPSPDNWDSEVAIRVKD